MTSNTDPETERDPHYQLGYAAALMRDVVRQHGTLDESTLERVTEWLEDLERLGMSPRRQC